MIGIELGEFLICSVLLSVMPATAREKSSFRSVLDFPAAACGGYHAVEDSLESTRAMAKLDIASSYAQHKRAPSITADAMKEIPESQMLAASAHESYGGVGGKTKWR